MEDFLIVSIIFLSAVWVVKIATDYQTRSQLIKKGEVNENLKYLFKNYGTQTWIGSNLKWGMVLIGIGLALLIKQFSPVFLDDETILGLVFVFAGLSFFIYYFIAKTRSDQSTADRDEPPR